MAENRITNFSVMAPSPGDGRSFTTIAERVLRFVHQYKTPLLLLLVVGLIVGIGVPVMKYRRLSTAMSFAKDMHSATKSLKKEESYQSLLALYGDLSATGLGRLKLAQHYVDNQAPEKALAILDAGLATAEPDIMGTLLVLKKVDVLKSQGKHKEAAATLNANTSKILPSFATRAQLISADLLLGAGLKEEARAALQKVATMGVGQEAEDTAGFDPETVDEAKERLLLLDLGVL